VLTVEKREIGEEGSGAWDVVLTYERRVVLSQAVSCEVPASSWYDEFDNVLHIIVAHYKSTNLKN
jgi:hypothetical protein